LAKAGCARRLLDALKGFPGQVKIQQGVIWALCNLSENCTRAAAASRTAELA